MRAGFYAGDAGLVRFLSEVRKHAGYMVPGPVQAAAAVALDDDVHVDAQRARYLDRLTFFRHVLAAEGATVGLPGGSFYLWAEAPAGDFPEGRAWAFTRHLAERGGVLVAPGDLYGEADAAHVRVAVVAPRERLALVADRLAAAR